MFQIYDNPILSDFRVKRKRQKETRSRIHWLLTS